MLSPCAVFIPAEPSIGSDGQGFKILVVDDEPMMRKFIAGSLNAGGFPEVIFGSNGGSVHSLALRENPRLIIMDVIMPGGNGMRAYRTLKNSARTAAIPVIMTSGFDVLAVDPSAGNMPSHLLAKPFTAQRLLEEVNRVLLNVEPCLESELRAASDSFSA